MAVSCDISEEDSREAAFKTLDNHGFTPDILVNSAGINTDSLLIRASPRDVAALINTNLIGTMLFTKGIVRSMLRARRGGCIVTVGSVIGTHGGAGQTAYAASKVRATTRPSPRTRAPPHPPPISRTPSFQAGLEGFTKALARELGGRGVRANVVAPGLVDSDMTAALSPARREEVAARPRLGRLGTPGARAEGGGAVEVRAG